MIEDSQDERELLDGLRAGDESVFEQMVTTLHPAMIRVALIHVSDRAAAEDVVQDTWLAVVRGLTGFEGRSSLRSWIFSILLNQARSAGGRDRRTLPLRSQWRADRAPAVDSGQFVSGRGPDAGRWVSPVVAWSELPEARLLARESMDHITALIAALPPRQRDAVMVRDVLGLPAAEAAVRLRQTEPAHRVFLHRGRHAMRAALTRRREEDR